MLELFSHPELVEQLLTGLCDGLAILDETGVKLFVNDALCQLTGYSREELLGQRAPFPYWPTEERETIHDAFLRAFGGGTATFELVFSRKNGERFPALVSASVLERPDGSPRAFAATVKDIGQLKQLEHSHAESERRWRSIAESPFDFVVIIDRAYRYTYVNHTAEGITREALIGKATPFEFTDVEFHDVMREAFDIAFKTRKATTYDVHIALLDRWYSTIVGPIEEHGVITSLSLLTRDITLQKRAEDELRRSELQVRESHKMDTVGTLAGGIAHDLNNILTPILMYSELAQEQLGPTHEIRPHLQAIQDSAMRARDLVQRILLFSRKQEPQKHVIDLGASVSEVVKLFRATLPAWIEMRIDLPTDPVWVLADRSQIDQLLANLATNAFQAIGDSAGKLWIGLCEVDEAPRDDPSTLGGRYASLKVTDSGVGMDAETARRAFDPFFTTKPTGLGTGLGLSIVHGIVQNHGGTVTVDSTPGQGARFDVRLPIVAREPTVLAEPPRSLERAHLPMRVLCVDDESAVVDVVRRALERDGHDVTTMTQSEDALASIEADPYGFDVLITDQNMPRMKGTELIKAVRSLRPDFPCLLMTGLDDEATMALARELGATEVLAKPFSPATLLTAIARAKSLGLGNARTLT